MPTSPKILQKPYDPAWISPPIDQALRSQRLLISVVGLAALVLPPAVFFIDRLDAAGCFRKSLSHYYYSPYAGVVFVMLLAFVGTLLTAYRAEARHVRRLAQVAGLAAVLVGVLPTEGPGCQAEVFDARLLGQATVEGLPVLPLSAPFVLFPDVGWWHYGAAAVTFAIMFYFCAFVFREKGEEDVSPDSGAVLPVKTLRNWIYAGCALVIALASVILLLNAFGGLGDVLPYNTTFWAETLALWGSGVAWLVKGRFFDLALHSQPSAEG